MNSAIDHFDKIASKYDGYKKNNSRYYTWVKESLSKVVLKNKSVLDYGCGTGEILNFLSPQSGVGYDPSKEMVNICRRKFKKSKTLKFVSSLNDVNQRFDQILMVDIIEHLTDVAGELKTAMKLMKKNAQLVVSYVDSKWEVPLMILEKLNLKMPEGPHRRISNAELVKTAKRNGLKLVSLDTTGLLISTLTFVRK